MAMRRARLLLVGPAVLVSPAAGYARQGRAMAILMPGAGGESPADFLIRNCGKIAGAGFETRVTTSPGEAAEIVRAERQKGRKVVLVGMNLGALHVGQVLGASAPADGAVLVSGGLHAVASSMGSPAKLPPTLIVHHHEDACPKTPPSGVGYFQQWSGGRARVSWIATTGTSDRRPCGPDGAHGFFRRGSGPVSAIVGFIRSR
jgi:hypothetical protein